MNTTRSALAAAGAGALLIGSLTTLASSCTPATAAPPALAATAATSTATGISVSGGEHLSASPSVSSSGAIKTAGGSVSTPSGAVVASGISLQAGAGFAEARVASVRVGGTTVGPFSATCRNGSITTSAPKDGSGNMKVSPGGHGTAGIITVTTSTAPIRTNESDAPNKPTAGTAITVTVATASCGAGTPPPPPNNPPTGTRPAPTHKPGAPATSRPGMPAQRHQQDDNPGDRTAPRPQPKPAHVAVTG
ncbi:hypothetical protein [Amycolatopsis sp. CA-128772]|uniref:hypothetical protein n=1 Tax=Amycolatopsis sp. CA-128772 TaxID=2073159 RepID=UPI0011B0402F|nr:hypothetical protein [Amycolatopsis sp. CA-128772]